MKYGIAIVLLSTLQAACGNMGQNKGGLWPFGQVKELERSRAPAGATAYQCPGGKQLYVRDLENGAAVWLTLPDRDLRLERDRSAAGIRYSRAGTTLQIEGNSVSVSDGQAAYKDCARV